MQQKKAQEEADKQTILPDENVPVIEKALAEVGLTQVVPNAQGMLTAEDFVNLQKSIMIALFSLNKTNTKDHVERRRNLIKAGNQ
jgi:hypothetical protein